VKFLSRRLPDLWFQADLSPALLPLLPFSWLFRGGVAARRFFYRLLAAAPLPVPVIVVGNLTVGGSGKTPLVSWLVKALEKAGKSPGIVSRGHGGANSDQRGEFEVFPDSPAALTGDEPLLLARQTGVPVVVGRDRARAARLLLEKHPDRDLIVSDDGMQHYRLGRHAEIAVFDARGIGNGRLLPAGPLREPLGRLAEVTAVVWNSCPVPGARTGLADFIPAYAMSLEGKRFYRLDGTDRSERKWCLAEELRGGPFHAVAGMGNPSRFFEHLKSLGLVFEAHSFPDHHAYTTTDFAFARGGDIVLMTEKDAVKCARVAPERSWVLPVEARVEPIGNSPPLIDILLEKL
jgi:tetraacyldisaccharide 4'-kinase